MTHKRLDSAELVQNLRLMVLVFNADPRIKEQITNAADHIESLEAEIDALRHDLEGYMNIANEYVNELSGVHAGTHKIVEVD